MKNKWKIAFWACLVALMISVAFGLYSILDQGVSLTYMKVGYSDTESDLDGLIQIINETNLTKHQIGETLMKQKQLEHGDLTDDTISLKRINLVFKDKILHKITKQW